MMVAVKTERDEGEMKEPSRARRAFLQVIVAWILLLLAAVTAWMGALTFTFMATEELKIMNIEFGGTGVNKWVAVTANNTGTATVTISEAWINNAKQSITDTPLSANQGTVFNMTYSWTTGENYQVKLVSSKGNQFVYSTVAPMS